MDEISNTKRGGEFESQVAALFIAAGYKIDRNPSLPGQQIDLVATNFDSFGLQRRVVVECKFLKDGTISNSTVQEFINYVKPLLDRGISGGIMVTNSDYSLPAKHFAASYPFIEIKTYEELEDLLFDSWRVCVVGERLPTCANLQPRHRPIPPKRKWIKAKRWPADCPLTSTRQDRFRVVGCN